MENFHLMDHDYVLPVQEDINQLQPMDIDVQEYYVNERPNSYVRVPSVHRSEHIIKDNLGYMYFKSKSTERKIYMRCKEYKNRCTPCTATGSISVNMNDNTFFPKKRHNHCVRRDDTPMKELRNILGQECVAHSPTPYSAKVLYMQAIKNCPEGAYSYTYLQATERMRQIRKSVYPPTPRNLLHLHQLLEVNENQHFTLTFQAQPNLFYQGPLMVNRMLVGLIFCNKSFIQDIAVELQNVTVAGCDGTFKTVPKTINNDCYQLFTFQIVYKNVSYPLVYALLNGKSEGIYTALFARIKDMIPLQYQNLMIITDYEIAQINAIHTVFREVTHQGCYFHYCQAILRHARNKSIGVYNLVKINPIAARVFRMILALPYLPSDRIGRVPSVVDGVNAIIVYMVQYEDVALVYHQFIYEYIIPFWLHSITPERFTVYNRYIRTNNYLESYHAVLLKIIRPHPKIWEFIDQLRYLENTCEVEFKQASNNLKIRLERSMQTRELNTRTIGQFVDDLIEDYSEERVVTFLRRAGHRIDGYITQQIGPYPGEPDLLLQNN